MDLIEPVEAELLRLRNPRVAHPLRTEIIAPAVRSAGPDQLRQSLDQHAQIQLALAQLLFELLALGQVSHDLDEPHQVPGFIAHRRRDSRSPEPFVPLAHHPTVVTGRAFLRHNLHLLIGGAQSHALRREHNLDMLSYELVAVIAEHVFAPLVPSGDDATRIGSKDGVILHPSDEIAIKLFAFIKHNLLCSRAAEAAPPEGGAQYVPLCERAARAPHWRAVEIPSTFSECTHSY